MGTTLIIKIQSSQNPDPENKINFKIFKIKLLRVLSNEDFVCFHLTTETRANNCCFRFRLTTKANTIDLCFPASTHKRKGNKKK